VATRQSGGVHALWRWLVAVGVGRVVSGPIKSLVGCTVPGGLARLNLFNYSKDFQKSNQFKLAKYENGTYRTKNFQTLHTGR
jgi:hypothetical protein